MQFVAAAGLSASIALISLAARAAHPTLGGKPPTLNAFLVSFAVLLVFWLLGTWLTFGPMRFFADFFAKLLTTDTGETRDESGGEERPHSQSERM